MSAYRYIHKGIQPGAEALKATVHGMQVEGTPEEIAALAREFPGQKEVVVQRLPPSSGSKFACPVCGATKGIKPDSKAFSSMREVSMHIGHTRDEAHRKYKAEHR